MKVYQKPTTVVDNLVLTHVISATNSPIEDIVEKTQETFGGGN